MRSCGMDVENDRRQRRARKEFFVFLKNAVHISVATDAFMCDGRIPLCVMDASAGACDA